MKMKPLFSLTIILLLATCSNKVTQYSGTPKSFKSGKYYKTPQSTEFLNFSPSGYFSYENSSLDNICCKKIAEGTYSVDEKHGFIYVSSPDSLNLLTVDAEITERKAVNSDIKDSIHFELLNDLEKNQGHPHNPFIYNVVAQFDNNVFETLKSDKPVFSIFIKPGSRLKNLMFEVFPNYVNLNIFSITRRVYVVPPYTVKDDAARHFVVDIRKLTLEYLSYQRLNKDIIRIIDDNNLEWDGYIYRKETE